LNFSVKNVKKNKAAANSSFFFLLCSLKSLTLSLDMDYTLNCNGRLLSLKEPQVMGIMNVTPDSFYANSRKQTEEDIVRRTEEILAQGGSIIDIGACSTRPGSEPASEAEEAERLRYALAIVRREAPQAIISIDTFRPRIARMAVEEFGADIINDVEGTIDMQRTVTQLRVPYIYMSSQATMYDILLDCAETTDRLRSLGQKDIVLDPGFGFGKTLEQNYKVMNELERMQMIRLPILVGISRKSMIYRLLNLQQEEALNGTTVLNTIALLKGASILRVHDVREAVECVTIVKTLTNRN
jgi:dihydropteroate synthase